MIETFEGTATEIIDLIEIGESDAAQLLATTLDEEFRTLVSQLEGVRDELAASVVTSDAFLGRIGNVARFSSRDRKEADPAPQDLLFHWT